MLLDALTIDKKSRFPAPDIMRTQTQSMHLYLLFTVYMKNIQHYGPVHNRHIQRFPVGRVLYTHAYDSRQEHE